MDAVFCPQICVTPEKKRPAMLEETLSIRVLAFANLSLRLYAIVFVQVRTKAYTTPSSQMNSNLRTATSPSTAQAAGTAYISSQKHFESIGLIYLSGLAVSYTQVEDPFSNVSFHHLRPTISLPETFLTVQKSMASSTATRMNTNSKSEIRREPNKYRNTGASRNAI